MDTPEHGALSPPSALYQRLRPLPYSSCSMIRSYTSLEDLNLRCCCVVADCLSIWGAYEPRCCVDRAWLLSWSCEALWSTIGSGLRFRLDHDLTACDVFCISISWFAIGARYRPLLDSDPCRTATLSDSRCLLHLSRCWITIHAGPSLLDYEPSRWRFFLALSARPLMQYAS